MQNKQMALGGARLMSLVGALVLVPKFGNKARLALRRGTGVTHRSGVSKPGVRATADPARGKPA